MSSSSRACIVAPFHFFIMAFRSNLELWFHKQALLIRVWALKDVSSPPVSLLPDQWLHHPRMSHCKSCSERSTTIPLSPKSTHNQQTMMGIHSFFLNLFLFFMYGHNILRTTYRKVFGRRNFFLFGLGQLISSMENHTPTFYFWYLCL